MADNKDSLIKTTYALSTQIPISVRDRTARYHTQYEIGETDVCNYADDNTLHARDISLNLLMLKLESASMKAIDWFEQNGMKLNPKKCHLLVSGHKHEQMIANIPYINIVMASVCLYVCLFALNRLSDG